MKRLTPARILAFAAVLIAVLAACPQAKAELGTISDVYVSPDSRNVFLKMEGQVGHHAAFVMQKPGRLVVDVESARLGRLPGKIRVEDEAINEIRLGTTNGKARVVIDFGDNPVPSFKIDRRLNMLVVGLGASDASPGLPGGSAPPPPHRSVRRPDSPKPERSERKNDDGPVSVKTAGVKDNLVFVELTDRKNPKAKYRLVVDLDLDALSVRNAAVSDDKGNVKRFDVSAKESSPDVALVAPKLTIGPRRAAATVQPGQSSSTTRFKWGLSATEGSEQSGKAVKAGPLRIEEFRLQARSTTNQR